MKNLELRFLSTQEKDQIVSLRQGSYKSYYGSDVDVQGLSWNWTDENSAHLGYLNKGELVSCLRLSIYQSLRLLESATLFTTPQTVDLPVAVLGRAVTSDQFSTRHLHTHLRVFALETCLIKNISTVVGSLEERSARLSSLKDFGYQILDRQDAWKESCVKSTGPVVLIGLTSSDEIRSAAFQMRKRYDITTLLPELPSISIL